MKTNAIRIHEYGGPEVLRWEEIDVPEPAAGEASIRHTAIGLNFIDTYHRTGLYPVDLPTGLGREAAGVVESLGAEAGDVAVGDRVVYTGGRLGSYSERRTLDASGLVPIPDFITDELAAAVFTKGLTAWYLLHRSYPVQKADTILLYAAAGGVGSIASQWAKRLGATVIGIVGTPEKAELAQAQGCDHILMADDTDIPGMVRELTGGVGVAAVYDSVGRDTFMTSLDCLRPHGTLVTFGNASGAVAPFAPAELAKRGSLYVTRPILEHFVATRAELLDAANTLFTFIREGEPHIRIGQTYALRDAAQAHRDLEARKTTGSTILLP
ncbi:MAG: quinone oxidoreductase [Gammaproteobacteria bacterium]|nr:quinone oxidoreductase [Gammaproteobacteria bacterium]